MLSSFLHHILPPQGLFVLLTITNGTSKQTVYSDINSMAQAAATFDTLPGTDVYYALSSYAQGWHKTANGKTSLRTAENIYATKSLYIDIDVDMHDSTKYSTKDEAYAALVNYNNAEGLPVPLIIESANGFHAYWVLDQMLTHADWLPYAMGFKAHMLAAGLKIDPAVTADGARVLRPLGTHNKKNGGHFPVRLVGAVPPVDSIQRFNKYWTREVPAPKQMEAANSTAPSADPYMGLVPLLDSNDKTVALMESAHLPDAELVVRGCKQLQACGSQIEPHWFGAMSILSKTRGGNAMAHQLSAMDPRYSEMDTETKYQQAKASDHPPTRCSTFEKYNPGGCEGCPNKIGGTVTPLYQRVDVVVAEALAEAVEEQAIPPYLYMVLNAPDMSGYRVSLNGDDFGIYRKVVETNTKTGETTVSFEFLTDRVLVPIYKVNPIYNPSEPKQNHSRLFWREIRQDQSVRDLEVFSNVFTNKAGFETWLLDNSVRVDPRSQEAVRQYMRSLWSGAVDHVPDLTEIDRVGWTKEKDKMTLGGGMVAGRHGFAIGRQVLWPNSPPTQLQPAPDLVGDLDKYGFSGDLKGWQKPLGILDNEHQVWAQCILCMVLGSVIAEHMPSRDGLPLIYVYSKGSGRAKSTAMKYAMSAYGDPQHMMVTGGSWGARIDAMIRANSMPTLHDELTQTSLKELEDLLMSQSQGVEKVRMAPTGGASRFSGRSWRSMAFSNGNLSFADSIASQTTNEGPLLARIIEINLDHLPEYKTDVSVKAVFDTSHDNYGVAGRMMIQHILNNMAACKARIMQYHEEVSRHYGGSSLERMWVAAIAVLKFGCEVGREIGVHNFTWDKLSVEADRWIHDMRKHLGIADDKEAGSFTDLFAHIYKGLIICDYYGKPKAGEPKSRVSRVREDVSPMARLDTETQELTIPNSVIRKWAKQSHAEYTKVMDAWEAAGRVKEKGVHRTVTVATGIQGGPNERCIVFDMSKATDVSLGSELTPDVMADTLEKLYGEAVPLASYSGIYED